MGIATELEDGSSSMRPRLFGFVVGLIDRLFGDAEPEGGATAHVAVYPDVAVMGFYQALDQEEADSGAFDADGLGVVDPAIGLEQLRAGGFRDACAAISD